jgi:hypothetical protein
MEAFGLGFAMVIGCFGLGTAWMITADRAVAQRQAAKARRARARQLLA